MPSTADDDEMMMMMMMMVMMMHVAYGSSISHQYTRLNPRWTDLTSVQISIKEVAWICAQMHLLEFPRLCIPHFLQVQHMNV